MSTNLSINDIIKINILTISRYQFSINVCPSLTTVYELKQMCEKLQNVSLDYIRLLYQGKEMDDNQELSNYNLENNSVIHLTMKLGKNHLNQFLNHKN